MTDRSAEASIDDLFSRVREGDVEAFSAWYARVGLRVRESLRSFAREVDVEAVMQEAMLTLWKIAPRLDLKGENASLRYAIRVARTGALMEIRKRRGVTREEIEAVESYEEGRREPALPNDPGLRRAIEECLGRLPSKPRAALGARLRSMGGPDAGLAASLKMSTNTYLQNIVRARRALRSCLEGRGVLIKGILA
jgi:RNA polymerase sigma factor (sigma-70 family)